VPPRSSRRQEARWTLPGPCPDLGIKGLKIRANEDLSIRSGVVGPPGNLTAFGLQRRDPAAHTKLATAVAHQHLVLAHQRRHGDGFAGIDVPELGLPDLFASLGINGNRMGVQCYVLCGERLSDLYCTSVDAGVMG
jgi:hypothetical protein